MTENNQLSDETKNNSTDTSSTDVSSAVIGNHENAIVPHKISNHDKLVQTMVMVDGEWINVNDTNDQANVKYDMHKVNKKVVEAQKGIVEAKNTADSAVKYADSAVSASKVNSDALVAQSSAIREAKSAMDSATAEIQQLKANTASDVAQIRADVAQVQNEVDTAKDANSASVDKLKSDIGLAQKDLDNVHDSLTKAQSAVEQNQKLINDSVTKINSDIAQSRQDIITAQQANNDLTKQLDTYSKEAQEQGKTIKTIQDNQDGFSITIADVKGDVTKVSDTVDRLSAGLKDAQGNIASVKAQADQLNATLTDHSKNINQLIATAKELSSTLKGADGRLSKVEQTASEQSTILSDLQGNLTQVRQTADGLVTTLKDAQGNIDQIKQDAKGTSEQLSNAQGDITALQKDVGGIKLTIADHDKNIHTLQADSKTLKDDMADAKGNISSLQKTSTSLVSEFKDHDGRLGKVEQTATEHTSELADTKGNVDKVTQKANTLQLLLSDAQKNIQNIQLDAKGLHDTLTGQSNQLANLNVTLNNLDSKYSGITGDLQSKQTALSTEQQQTKDMLLNKADKSEVDNIKGTVNQVSAEQKIMAGQISQKVSSSDYQKDKDDTITSIEKNTTAIDENSKAIKLKADATEVDNVKNTVQQNSSRLDVMANEIQSKVTSTDVNNIVDSKGYATTSTVQSLITQKAGTINESITNLTNKVNSNNGGGVNLLQGTAKIEFPLNNNGGTQTIEKYDDETNYIQHTSSAPINDMGPWWPWTPEVGQVYTFSADVAGNGYITGDYFHYEGSDSSTLSRVDLTDNWQRISNTFRVNTISGNWVIYANNSTLLKVKHIKIERGSVATPWTPAPSDNASVSQLQSVTASIDGLQSAVKNKVDQSQYTQLAGVVQTKVSQSDFNRLDNQVNVQTLDSADINNMKANGHYFVHNLANNPIGGWVYVDVTGNGNDRIRQDVYQDIGTKHAFRRWFNTYWTEWSTGAEESEITQLRNDINLRVKSGDLLSQINIAAGHTLIQSNKIYFDADSFVMSPNSTAFIPSAYITDINADKINTGTLHSITINNGNGTFRVDPDGNVVANSIHVNNGSIYQGQILGADLYSISNLTSNSLNSVNDATQNWVKLKDGTIELHGANGDHYSSIVPIDLTTTYGGDGDSTDVQHGLGILDSREVIIGSASLDSDDNNRITHSTNFSVISRTHLGITNSYIKALLDPDVEYGKGASFFIQKDNKVGFYVGVGDNGNQVNVQFAGDGSGFNILGNFNVYGAKNSAVKTSQGDVAVSAYETAEYYFGDIGEGQTGDSGIAFVGIEKLFSETVNTSIPYQVFITAYGPGNLWVDQREHDRFVVKSDRPNVKFGWEIKAKRRGYENTRLQKVN